MPLPDPVPGLVISYVYLLLRERTAGRDEGLKTRPCAIIAALRTDEFSAIRALVLPITHHPPGQADVAVEIPHAVKARLVLDDDAPSWIILSEWNGFAWPSPDLRRIPGQETFTYGFVPPKLFRTLQARFLEMVRKGEAERVSREN